MTQEKEALIIVVSAPSGSGKTTLVNRLLAEIPGIKQTVSFTTREPRKGEIRGEDYVFISSEDFKKRIENEEFLEWEENFGNYYGTSSVQVREMLDAGYDIVLSIDVKGAKKIKKTFPESVSIFIMPPSAEELATRLRSRNTDDEQAVARRLKESRRELEEADEYDYMIVNEDLDKAVEEIKTVIKNERKSRINKQKEK